MARGDGDGGGGGGGSRLRSEGNGALVDAIAVAMAGTVAAHGDGEDQGWVSGRNLELFNLRVSIGGEELVKRHWKR